MAKKSTFLNDADCEPTDEDWAKITKAAGDKVRSETQRMAEAGKERARQTDQTDPDEQ